MFWEIVWNILLFISFNRPVSVMGISKIQWKMEGGQGQRPCHSILSPKILRLQFQIHLYSNLATYRQQKCPANDPKKRPKLPANECVFLRQTLSCQKFKVWPSENKCELWRRQSARILTYQWPVWQVRVGGIFYKRLEQNNKRPTTQLSNWKFPKDLNLSNLLPTQASVSLYHPSIIWSPYLLSTQLDTFAMVLSFSGAGVSYLV